MKELDATVTTRIPRALRTDLDELAADRGEEPLALARTFLREGVRRERFPGITFRESRGERRACVEGRRLDIWQVMETVWASDGDVAQAASYLGLSAAQVRTAVGYYTRYPVEIDDLVSRNQRTASDLEEQWRREQAALRR